MALDQTTLDALLDTVSKFVRERLVPLEAQVAREDRIPDTIVAEMRALGLFGMTIPEEFGGLGLGLIAQVADSADVRAPESGGTEVVMRFALSRAA